MALTISTDQVYEALVPWFGQSFLHHSDVVSHVQKALHYFTQREGNFFVLHEKVEKILFMELYRFSNGTMTVMVNQQSFRIHSSNFTYIADDALSLYLCALKPTPLHFELIKRYSMEQESLAALKALYLYYDHLQTFEEEAVIKRMIIGIYPPWRYEKWIEKEKKESL